VQIRRGLVLFLFTVFTVACASRKGCDPIDLDLDLDFSGEDKCTPAGGTCSGLFCPSNTVPSTLDCGAFLSGCCMPSRGGSSGGTSGGPGPPPPDREGTCNDQACRTGCLCRPTVGNAFGCAATCDCTGSGGDAGVADAGDPDADAGDPDAGAADGGLADAGDVDGGDGGDGDGGEDDGGDASTTPAGPPQSCGVITCAARCDCLSRSLSICQCRTSACNP
jgi:hypothetical protein